MPFPRSRVPRQVFTRSAPAQQRQLAVQRQRQVRQRQLAVQRKQQQRLAFQRQFAARQQQLAVAKRQAAPPSPELAVASYVARQDAATAQQFTGLVKDIASANPVALLQDTMAAIFDAFGDADDSPGSAIAKNNAFLIAAGAIPEATVPRTRTGVIRPHGTEIE